MILDLYQSLQKEKPLLVVLASENKHAILNDDFKDIGTCIKAINIKRIEIKDGLALNESLFFEVNLFREV